MDRLDLLVVQGTLKSLLQHHSSKPLILRHSAFFMVQLKVISPFLFWPHSLQDLSSQTRDRTLVPYSGSAEY